MNALVTELLSTRSAAGVEREAVRTLSIGFRRPHIKQTYVDQVIARFREELGEEGGGTRDGGA